MLNYGNEQNFVGKTEEEKNALKREFVINEVDKRQKLLIKKQEQVNDIRYESELVAADIAFIIREDMVVNPEFNVFAEAQVTDLDDLLNGAWLEKSSANKAVYENFSQEVKDKSKASADLVLNIINTKIFNSDPDFKLVDVSKPDEKDHYWFVYDYKGVSFLLAVPVFSIADSRNYGQLLDGYLVACKENPEEPAAKLILRSLNYKNVLPAIQKWYAEYITAIDKQPEHPASEDKKTKTKKGKDAAN